MYKWKRIGANTDPCDIAQVMRTLLNTVVNKYTLIDLNPYCESLIILRVFKKLINL